MGKRAAVSAAAAMAALWAASITLWFLPAPAAVVGTLDSAATVLTLCTFAALVIPRLRPRLRPGERLVRDTEYFSVLEAISRGLGPADAERSRPRLKAVSPVSRRASGQ